MLWRAPPPPVKPPPTPAAPAARSQAAPTAFMEWSLLALPQRAGVLSVDLVDLREPIDLPHAGLWYVTAFAGPRPLGHRWLDAPDTHLSPDFVRLLFSAELMTARRLQLAQGFAERLGVEQREPAAATVTVVVCTRRRREHVERLLDDLVLLDPAPLEILVVDNDPGDEDVEQIALEHRARYLALHEPGLNRARAAAVAHARGEVIAFIDDDCRVPPGWLAAVDRVFADPAVAAATGPAFPVALDTPAQIAFEQTGGFGRGYEPRVVDWRTLPPSSATSLGSGNNMLLRRSPALAIEDLFPPELDAGTATESGGDLYALAALLHAGGKLAFEPELWVRHVHREDGPGLDRVLRGYGTGVVAGLLTLMRTHGDPDTLITGRWLWTQLRDATARRIASRAEPIELAGSVAYVRGALRAPAALRRARRAARGA